MLGGMRGCFTDSHSEAADCRLAAGDGDPGTQSDNGTSSSSRIACDTGSTDTGDLGRWIGPRKTLPSARLPFDVGFAPCPGFVGRRFRQSSAHLATEFERPLGLLRI